MCDFCVALALPMPAGIGSLSRETGIAFARSCAPGIETAIAFAGEKRAFLMQLSGAEVIVVSMVAVLGRALVMAVSRWSASVVAVVMAVSRWSTSAAAGVMAVSQLQRGCVLCAKKFALLGLIVGASAKKFAQRTKNCPQSAVCGVLGEVFRENTAGGVALGEVFRG